jgi:hypothetical protein
MWGKQQDRICTCADGSQRVVSRHTTSEGEVRYLACSCGVIRVVLNGVLFATTAPASWRKDADWAELPHEHR